MDATLVKQALENVLTPNILVNLISRRVRQLNSGGGKIGLTPWRPGRHGLLSAFAVPRGTVKRKA